MSRISSTDENVRAIEVLMKALAYTQETTVLGKLDPSDISSPTVPKYSKLEPVLLGPIRNTIEDKIVELVRTL